MDNLDNLNILEVFTLEDVEFNKKMVDRALKLREQKKFPERRGGKMLMNNRQKSDMFKNRDYDFASEILGEFRRKWGIPE